nr:MAG TPA: hypothetical protein [Caudoviricetes sp.]
MLLTRVRATSDCTTQTRNQPETRSQPCPINTPSVAT